MSNDTYLVLGATGKTGRRVAARLRMHGVAVRAASRSSAHPFDWSDPGTWDAVLSGATAAWVVPPAVPGPVHDFVAHAEAAGLRRLVLLSGRGADSWGDTAFGQDMRDAEAAVRASALQWTVLRPNNFAQNFDEELWHAPILAGELALPAGPVGEPFIDLEDVADVAAAVLLEPAGHEGRIHELTGPRSIRFPEAAEMISRVLDRPITYKEISAEEYAAALVEQGLPGDAAHHIAEMFVMMQRGVLCEPTDGVAAVLGREPRSFEDYVLRTAASGAWTR